MSLPIRGVDSNYHAFSISIININTHHLNKCMALLMDGFWMILCKLWFSSNTKDIIANCPRFMRRTAGMSMGRLSQHKRKYPIYRSGKQTAGSLLRDSWKAAYFAWYSNSRWSMAKIRSPKFASLSRYVCPLYTGGKMRFQTFILSSLFRAAQGQPTSSSLWHQIRWNHS